MKTRLVILVSCLLGNTAYSQTVQEIVDGLRQINKTVLDDPCVNRKTSVISNRAGNLFLAHKIGYSLSDYSDMSFRKNYVTYNTATGTFSLNHNFFQAQGNDNGVKSFFVAGVEAQAAKPYSFWHSYSSDLNATIKQTWIGRTKFFVNDCSGTQKQIMDAQRAVVLKTLESQLQSDADDFEKKLASLTPDDLPGQAMDAAKQALRKKFYSDLSLSASQKFVELQAGALTDTNSYSRIATHWTSISASIPLISQLFLVAETYQSSFDSHRTFPFLITLSHTRFYEGPSFGKIFLTTNAQLALSNSYLNNGLVETGLGDYKSRGGLDTTSFLKDSFPRYIGRFKSSFNPIVAMKCVYFPFDSHIGVSISAEKTLSDYNPLNFKLGIPVVLIDKLGHPAANFEFQVLYYDAANTVFQNLKLSDKTSISLTVGVPFSKVIF